VGNGHGIEAKSRVIILLDSRAQRVRAGWWIFVLLLGLVAAFIAGAFIGLLALGVFGYYATRPINRRIGHHVDSEAVSAGLTVVLVLLPIVAVAVYALVQVLQQLPTFLNGSTGLPALVRSNVDLRPVPPDQRRAIMRVLETPTAAVSPSSIDALARLGVRVVSALAGTLVLLALSVTLSYFLLKNDDELSTALRDLFGGTETTAYAYATAVDGDLESVFFGNLLFVVAMTAVSAVAYSLTNLLAPAGLAIPMVFVLAFLTGVASLIPIVVGKVVYLPVVATLTLQAYSTPGRQFAFVAVVFTVYFLLLDLLPQTFLQPYLSGRHLDMVMLMFGYLLGPILFGWYGFFLLPIIFVVMLEAVRIVLPELVRGESLTPTVSLGESIGTDPRPDHGDDDVDDTASDDTGSATDRSDGEPSQS
jgi:predicted PurR-regulated permease PerM